MQKTPFYDCHLRHGGKVVEFCGWALPINYGSQIKEHECVRTSAGMFDVSHMAITDVYGDDARNFLRHLLSNDVAKLEKHVVGKALYSAMLNENGGVIDDLIVYRTPFGYRVITNAATYSKDMAWIEKIAEKFNVKIKKHEELAMIAVQGPDAIAKVAQIKPEIAQQLLNLKSFESVVHHNWYFARTGYTGEHGLEIILPDHLAHEFWEQLIQAGVTPCGLGSRDTLRLEAGLNLYGHDMDEGVSPLECNIGFAVDVSDDQRDFIGKQQYVDMKSHGKHQQQIGIVLEGSGVLREGQKIIENGKEIGVITSGTFSPTLKHSIAMARVTHKPTNACVEIRGVLLPIKVVTLPFVRHGKKIFS